MKQSIYINNFSVSFPDSIRESRNRLIILFIILFVFASILIGCKTETTSPPPKVEQIPSAQMPAKEAATPLQEELTQDSPEQEGYVYEQRGRRDPFVPLIVPTEKWQKKDTSKLGTLEGYDLSEFALTAIAKKGTEYFALLITPDKRSFTVRKGTVIGLSRGRVEKITSDEVILTENTRNFRGELRPRQLILELHKGEVK